MTLKSPNRKPVCFNFDTDIKTTLSMLAKYHKTTLTNLLEQGARNVIQQNLKQIRNQQIESNQLESSLNW